MKTMLVVLALSHGADLGSTLVGLKHGAHEIVLPTQSPVAISVIVGAELGVESYGLLKLSREHPRAAKVIGWSIVGFRTTIAIHNVNQLRKVR